MKGTFTSNKVVWCFISICFMSGVTILRVFGQASPTPTPTPTSTETSTPTPIPLSNNTPVNYSDIPQNFSFTIYNNYWCGVGIYPTTDHDIRIDDNSDFSSPYAYSSFGSTVRDFVVTSGHQWGNATHYAQVYYGSSSNYTIEAEWDIPHLSVGSGYSGSITSGEILDVYEIFIDAGQQYTLKADVTSGNVDLSIFVFKCDRRYGTRSDADWDANSAGSGGDESIIFTTNITGDHGIAVVSENSSTGDYTILVSTPTPTPTPTPTNTPTPTPTGTPTPTPTKTPTPTPTPTPQIDLIAFGTEVTQGTQDMGNNSRLAAGKTTMVRAYVWLVGSGSPVSNVTARLYGNNGDMSPLPGSPLSPCNGPITLSPGNPNRGNINGTLNFMLPASWRTAGWKIFQTRIDPYNVIPESNEGNNYDTAVSVNFEQTKAINFVMVRVWYLHGSENLTPGTWAYWGSSDWLYRIYPTTKVNLWHLGNQVLKFTGDLDTDKGWSNLLKDLYVFNFYTEDPAPNCKYYGLIHQNVDSTFGSPPGERLGLGYTPGSECIGKVFKWNLRLSGNILGHELGHNFGYEHSWSDYGNSGTCYPDYPVDVFSKYVFPNTTHDLMNYGEPVWPNAYTYDRLFSRFAGIGAAALPDKEGQRDQKIARVQKRDALIDEFLVATGIIFRENGTGEPILECLDPMQRLFLVDGGTTETGTGSYSIVLEDSVGTRLFERMFEPQFLVSEEGIIPERGLFNEIIPYATGTRWIVFLYDTSELHRVTVSPNAPEVAVVFPNGSESLSGKVNFSWTASDADGTTMSYTIQMSRDNGASWFFVANHLSQTSEEVDVDNLPGGDQYLARVVASDGVNSGIDESDGTFSISKKPPFCNISAPATGSGFSMGEPVTFIGGAFDPEDGSLEGDSLSWSSDIDGDLGTGRMIEPDSLTQGVHNIELKARDSDGNIAAYNIIVYVGVTSTHVTMDYNLYY